MFFTYLDESGCTGAMPSATSQIQPIFSLLAVTFQADVVPQLTKDFLQLKKAFFPAANTTSRALNAILTEVKGGDIRREIRSGNRSQVRHHLLFLGKLMQLVQANGGRLYGRLYVKPISGSFDGTAVYTSATQSLCHIFQNFLAQENAQGIIIADSRNYGQNTVVAHSIFTEKFRHQGDKYPNILEMPVFGHSDNHAGIQICDLINSAIIYPIACNAYCTGFVTNVHVNASYAVLQKWFGGRLKELQYRY